MTNLLLFRVQSTLRRRLNDRGGDYLGALQTMVDEWGATLPILTEAAAIAPDWDTFQEFVSRDCITDGLTP